MKVTDTENVLNDLIVIINEQIISDSNIQISENMKLKEDLGFDSLRLVSLILDIEEKMNITFDESELDPGELIMVKDLIRLIENTRQRG